MADSFPVPAFNFEVGYDDGAFQEVSGLEVEMEVEEVIAGGQNNYVYRLPKRVKYKNLVLKRGFFKGKIYKILLNGIFNATNIQGIKPMNFNISLKDEKGSNLITWAIIGAYPVKWSMSNLNAQENALAFETIEFAYQYFTINPIG